MYSIYNPRTPTLWLYRKNLLIMPSFHNNFHYSQQQPHSKRNSSQFKKKKRRTPPPPKPRLFSWLPLSTGNTTHRRTSPHPSGWGHGYYLLLTLPRRPLVKQFHMDDKNIWPTDLAALFSQLGRNRDK